MKKSKTKKLKHSKIKAGSKLSRRDADISKELGPCRNCGCEDSIYKDEAYNLVEKDPDIDLTIPVYICRECGQTAYHNDVYKEILEAREAASGRPYRRAEVKNGEVNFYTLH